MLSWGTTPSAHRCHLTGDQVKLLVLLPVTPDHFPLKPCLSSSCISALVSYFTQREFMDTYFRVNGPWYQRMLQHLPELSLRVFRSLDLKMK